MLRKWESFGTQSKMVPLHFCSWQGVYIPRNTVDLEICFLGFVDALLRFCQMLTDVSSSCLGGKISYKKTSSKIPPHLKPVATLSCKQGDHFPVHIKFPDFSNGDSNIAFGYQLGNGSGPAHQVP